MTIHEKNKLLDLGRADIVIYPDNSMRRNSEFFPSGIMVENEAGENEFIHDKNVAPVMERFAIKLKRPFPVTDEITKVKKSIKASTCYYVQDDESVVTIFYNVGMIRDWYGE